MKLDDLNTFQNKPYNTVDDGLRCLINKHRALNKEANTVLHKIGSIYNYCADLYKNNNPTFSVMFLDAKTSPEYITYNKQNILLTAKHKMLTSKIDAVMNQFKQLKLLKSLDIGNAKYPYTP